MEPSLGFLEAQAFVYLAVFCRIGSAMMILPTIGDMMVPQRVRLMLALIVSAVLTPVVGPVYPVQPEELGPFSGLLLGEFFYGLAIGTLLRMFLMALNVAGTVIASQTGLAFAQNYDPTLGVQGALLGSFFSMLAMTLILQADLHHAMLAAVRDSYVVFRPGIAPDFGAFADLATRTFSLVFRLGVQMAAPFIVFSLVFYAAAGAVARLLPQVQIFFLAVPLNILAGFGLLALLLSSMMMLFLNTYEQNLMQWF